jgi:hypothetical protein
MGEQPTIVRNPAGDREFEADIDSALTGGVLEPEDLETRLRQVYPRVVVRPRALADERHSVWYVYRDGRWTSEG